MKKTGLRFSFFTNYYDYAGFAVVLQGFDAQGDAQIPPQNFITTDRR